MGFRDIFGTGQGAGKERVDDRIDEKGDIPEEEVVTLIDAVADKVVSMRLSTVAIFTLESVKPFTFLGGQTMYFFEPFVQSIFNFSQYGKFARILDDRKNVEKLMLAIERKEDEYSEKEREEKRQRKKERKRKKKS